MEEITRVLRFIIKEAAWRAQLPADSINLDRSFRQVKQCFEAHVEHCYYLANTQWELKDHIQILEAKLAKKENKKERERLNALLCQLAAIEGQLAQNHETVELLGHGGTIGTTQG